MTTSTVATQEFLTIKEASEKYGKAEITIRRLVRSIVQPKNHPERAHIHPTVEEAQALKKQAKPYAYTISTELLAQKYAGPAAVKSDVSKKERDYQALIEKVQERLIEQLHVKDQQIRALNQSLDEMTARQRETNILMKGLQEKFLPLPAPVVEATAAAPSAPARKGWFSWGKKA